MLDSNLFTHRNTYAILREATSETYGPRVYLLSYLLPIYFYLHLLLSNLYHKNTKNIYLILLSLSDLTFASGREGIDNPFIALVTSSLFVCVGAWDFWGASYWIDTLVLKNWGKYLRYFAASPFPLQGKTNACSRGSKKDFWRRCRGDLRTSQDIPSTHHKLLSLALHYLPFASRFPLPHFTLAVLFALSFPITSSLYLLPISRLPLLGCLISFLHGAI